MPNWTGPNRHQAEARERQAQAKSASKEAKAKAAEDAYWADDDKLAARKQQRQQEEAEKAERRARLKDEREALLGAEDEQLSQMKSKKGGGPKKKLTQAELNARLAKLRKKKAEAAAADSEKKTQYHDLPEQNPNRADDEEGDVDAVATTVDEAIAVLGGCQKSAPVDQHPERRLKATHAAFVDANLPRVKADHPGLKLSQYKDMLWKEWQKSPENPLVAAALAKAREGA